MRFGPGWIVWKLALRQIRQHPSRTALTLASITIGVAAVVAITVAARTTDQAMNAMFQSLTGRASLEVSAAGGGSMPQNVMDRLADVGGIQTAAAVIQRPTVLFFQDHRVKLTSLGIVPETYQDVHPHRITAGKSLDQAKGVLLSAALGKSIAAKPGDAVKLLTRRGLVKARVVGWYQSQETILTTGGVGLLMTLPAAQYSSKMPGKISMIQVVLEPTADEETVREAIASRLPIGIQVNRPVARSSFAEETVLSIRQGMLTARAFLLLVATLIIANTYLINVTQRRQQFGIMRAIGATQRQVALLLGCEGLLVGLLGSLLGWVVGIAGANYLNDALSRLYETPSPAIEITLGSFGLAMLFGISVSLIGVGLPARRAGRLSPAEAMREALPTETEGSSQWLSIAGTLLVVLCGGSLAAGIMGWLPAEASAWSGVLILTGLVLLMPLVVRPLSWLAAWILQPLLRVESRLARMQLLRHRTRTTLTIGVLFVAISTGIGLASSVIDNVSDVKNWYRRTMVADYFIRAMSPDMATGQAADMPDEVGVALHNLDHITGIETVRFVRTTVNDRSVIVVAHDFAGSVSRFFDGAIDDQRVPKDQLRRDDVMIGSVLAKRAGGLQAGQQITLETDQGAKPLRIAALVNDYLAGGQTIYMNRDLAERLFHVTGVDAYLIHVDHDHFQRARWELEKIATDNGLILESFSEIHQQIDRRMSGVVAGLWGVVILGFIVATLGVSNTLTMNVLEQTRELGLLRIVGATQWQVRRIVVAQAWILGILSLLPGTVAGVVIAYLISLTSYPLSGHPIAFVFHPALMIGGLVFGFLVVIAAAWLPAQRAARLALLDTLRVA